MGKQLKKKLPILFSGAFMIFVGIAGLRHSVGAYARIDCLIFTAYVICSAVCIAVGLGILIQSNTIVQAIDGKDD